MLKSKRSAVLVDSQDNSISCDISCQALFIHFVFSPFLIIIITPPSTLAPHLGSGPSNDERDRERVALQEDRECPLLDTMLAHHHPTKGFIFMAQFEYQMSWVGRASQKHASYMSSILIIVKNMCDSPSLYTIPTMALS